MKNAKSNEIVKILLDDHERILMDIAPVEDVLRNPNMGDEVWDSLEKLVEIANQFGPHFMKETKFLFPALDELPKSDIHILAFNDLFPLVKFEHDDWIMISSTVNRLISGAVKRKNKQLRDLSVLLGNNMITFMKRHFSLEEAVAFPMVLSLSDEKQENILARMRALK
ncbi:MAG: hemerythrin domain-containing protein [Candidatus Hadarchaeota archaeon]